MKLPELRQSIADKNTSKIRELISTDPNVLDETDEAGRSGLMLLVYNGDKSLITEAASLKSRFSFYEAIVVGRRDLLEEYIKTTPSLVNSNSPDGFSGISLAAFFDQQEIAIFLLEHGADPGIHAINSQRVNALHAAVARNNAVLAKLFLEHGVSPNAPQAQDVTPLHAAAHHGNVEIVSLLLKHGADPNLKMANGDTPLSIAERDGHSEVVQMLKSFLLG